MVVGAVASGWLANHENVSLDFAAAALAATNNHLILFFVVVIREKVRMQGVSSRESGPLFYICAKVVASQKIGIAFFCMVRQAFSGNTYIWLLLVSRFIIIVILYFCVRNEM